MHLKKEWKLHKQLQLCISYSAITQRTIKWFGWEGTFKGHLVQALAMGRDILRYRCRTLVELHEVGCLLITSVSSIYFHLTSKRICSMVLPGTEVRLTGSSNVISPTKFQRQQLDHGSHCTDGKLTPPFCYLCCIY